MTPSQVTASRKIVERKRNAATVSTEQYIPTLDGRMRAFFTSIALTRSAWLIDRLNMRVGEREKGKENTGRKREEEVKAAAAA